MPHCQITRRKLLAKQSKAWPKQRVLVFAPCMVYSINDLPDWESEITLKVARGAEILEEPRSKRHCVFKEMW